MVDPAAEIAPRSAASVLIVTLDSCRYDSFAAAAAPHLRAVGPLRRAEAPSHFTYGSHAAMFVGFTPGVTEKRPWVNPKFARLFRVGDVAWTGPHPPAFDLAGANLVEGFRRRGYRTLGTGAVRWFDPATETGRHLTDPFHRFHYAGHPGALPDQLAWLAQELAAIEGDVLAFLNLGETHVPYWHQGAAWSADDNPCIPFGTANRAADCRSRQQACVEYADALLAPLLAAFGAGTILACADHGDAWGEDGLWEHGISHPTTLEVPLLLRVRGEPV